MKTSIYILIGVRPDIAFIVFALFIFSLFFCVMIAKKHHLFYFSQLLKTQENRENMENTEDEEKA